MRLWVARTLFLMKMIEQNREQAEKFGFLEYMECLTPVDNMAAFLGFISLRRSTDDKVDHTVESLTGSREINE